MPSELASLVGRWAEAAGLPASLRPDPGRLARDFAGLDPCRPGAAPSRLRSWEVRFGYRLPTDLRAWLALSDGFYGPSGPLVHPLSSIGPMVPFARVPGMALAPESWFELGNPDRETVCIDLAYRWTGPDGDCPLFTSGDDASSSPPRLIACGFAAWFLRLLHGRGREYWFDPAFRPLGDPWLEHRRRVAAPALPDRLRPLLGRALALLGGGLDDRVVARSLAITRADVEILVRHGQHHRPADAAPVAAEAGI